MIDRTVPVDAIDAQGRRYLEVPEFPDGALRRAFADHEPDHCIDCDAPIRHGVDRYFQRNDRADGTCGNEFAAALLALTFDSVCGSCGDAALRKDSR